MAKSASVAHTAISALKRSAEVMRITTAHVPQKTREITHASASADPALLTATAKMTNNSSKPRVVLILGALLINCCPNYKNSHKKAKLSLLTLEI